MRAIHRKLFRDLWQMRGQASAVGLVIACGIAVYVMSLSMYISLKRAKETYYERYRFAHVFAHAKRVPEVLAGRLAAIPGVGQVQTRVVVDVTLDVPGMTESAAGRLVSISERPAPGLNELYLRKGRYIEPGRDGEVLASEAFADAHGFKPGDTLRAVINGRMQQLRIVGVALSPEFIYQIREGDLLPDDRRFGVFWMGRRELATAFDMDGAFNNVVLSLLPGASEEEVLRQVDRLLEPYGGLGAYGRDDQASHKFIANELNELRGMALVMPTIFLAVAAFLLYVSLNRLINAQREQIAALKAFGYSGREVGVHYLQMVMGIILSGTLLGMVVGAWLGRELTVMYARFFHFPIFDFRLDERVAASAFGVGTVAGLLGTLTAIRRAARLPPAEAMRPEPPADFRPTIVERLGLQALVSPTARMIVRHLERRPVKAVLTCTGIALATAVVVLGNFMVDVIHHVMDTQFRLAQRQDLTVSFVEPANGRVLGEIAGLPGVIQVEPMRGVPVRFRHGPRSRRLSILGLPPDANLYRILDTDRRLIPIPPDGLIMSQKLGEVLDAGPGDFVTVEVLEGLRPVRHVPIRELVNDFEGMSAYMNIEAVRRLMQEEDSVTGAVIAIDPSCADELHAYFKDSPRVAGVAVKTAQVQSFEETIAENLLRMRLFNVVFASIIACGVVYNSARITLAERSRELATLRVIGFTRGETSFVMLGELAVLTLLAVPLGLVVGHGMAALVIELAFDTELFRIPLVVSGFTYGFAASVTLTAAVLSALVVRRMIDRLDLVAVLKSKE